MAALVRCAAERGQSITQLAEALGYSYPYINLLMSGLRRVDQVSDDFVQACAVYLRLPRLAVLMMSGRLKAEDFFEVGAFRAKAVEAAMRCIEDDPQWGSLLTPELRKASPESRFCLVKLYESATGRRLLDGELDPKQFGEQLHAHFSDRGRLFQSDRGRRFSAIVDAPGVRASDGFNVSQSSTISLKRLSRSAS
ncbi:hypothetical protein [Thiomonas sp. FB-Cd]|uniref:hypothetical protein n=1 Tax=Thiomonas sp. FB-Cd TaxID=1158292 RepID=UPI000690C8BE|nr:hypothetical protein [Thiomonas sp. FB-Cd]